MKKHWTKVGAKNLHTSNDGIYKAFRLTNKNWIYKLMKPVDGMSLISKYEYKNFQSIKEFINITELHIMKSVRNPNQEYKLICDSIGMLSIERIDSERNESEGILKMNEEGGVIGKT